MFGSGPVTVPKYPAGMEVPPSKDEAFVPNPHTWAKATSLLYIEQPAGTGFSYGPTPDNEDDVSRDVYNFLINLFRTFPHLEAKDIYLWGGSYSGMMVSTMFDFSIFPTAVERFSSNNSRFAISNENLYCLLSNRCQPSPGRSIMKIRPLLKRRPLTVRLSPRYT